MEKIVHWLSVRRLNFESFVFYLLLFFLPTQLGKHFWPSFSYVLGIRSDYLSPTIYFTDILVFILFCLWIARTRIKNKNSKIIISYFILLVFYFLFWPGNKSLELYGVVKIIEFSWFGWYISRTVFQRYSFQYIVRVFAIASVIESVLATAEFINQRSLDGIWYWFGERHFTVSTIGIADMSLHGALILRPYATFSHPNVLAGYLLLSSTMLLFLFIQGKQPSQQKFTSNNWHDQWVFLLSFLISSFGLFLTFSRSAIFAWVCMLIIVCYISLKNKKRFFILLSIIVIVGVISFFIGDLSRFLSLRLADETVIQRVDLLSGSWLLLQQNPILGVGINNFIPSLATLQTYQLNFFLLQPVHNIFILLLVETGIVGGLFILFFLYKTIRMIFQRLRKQNKDISFFCMLLLLEIFLTGSVDHYWVTQQQGQLLLSFVFGLCWKAKTNSATSK